MSAVKSSKRSRGWCFTHNNPTELDSAYLYKLYEDRLDIEYIISGLEVGRNGTPHIQGYIYFKDAKSFKKVKSLLIDDCHIEAQKSKSNAKAYVYCMKENNYIELGERPRQGHRTDLEAIKHDIIAGKDFKYLWKTYFAQTCQYSRQFAAAREYLRDYDRTALILYDEHTIQQVYQSKSEYENPLIVECDAMLNFDRLSHAYYSRKYDAIFYPNSYGLSQHPIHTEIKYCLYDIED